MSALDAAIRQAEEALQRWRDSPLAGWHAVPLETRSDAAALYLALRDLLDAAKAPALAPQDDVLTFLRRIAAKGCDGPNPCAADMPSGRAFWCEACEAAFLLSAPPADALPEAVKLAAALARLERIDAHAGQTCEAQGHSIDPCGPVEYEDVEGVPLCAECWGELVEEALSAPPADGEVKR